METSTSSVILEISAQSDGAHDVNKFSISAPEVLGDEPAYPQTDIWSVGVLAYIMLSGTSPFRGNDENETRANISSCRFRFENLYREITPEVSRFFMFIFKRTPL